MNGNIYKMSDKFKLYRIGEVPADLKGRGVWLKFGNEMLFSPFDSPAKVDHFPEFDWTCEYCKQPWYKSQVIKNEYHCPRCGKWAGLLEVDR